MNSRPAVRNDSSLLSGRIRYLVYAAAVVGAVLGLIDLWYHFRFGQPMVDFHAYYEAAARLNAGQTLYLPERDPFFPDYYRYPPLLAILARPLALLDYDTAATVWFAILVIATALTPVALGVRRRETWLAMGILGFPIAWSLSIGQAQVLVTLFLAIGSPWAVALAAQVKLLPALVALYWLGRRDWRRLGTFVGVSRRPARRPAHPRPDGDDRLPTGLRPRPGRQRLEPVAVCGLAGPVGRSRPRRGDRHARPRPDAVGVGGGRLALGAQLATAARVHVQLALGRGPGARAGSHGSSGVTSLGRGTSRVRDNRPGRAAPGPGRSVGHRPSSRRGRDLRWLAHHRPAGAGYRS